MLSAPLGCVGWGEKEFTLVLDYTEYSYLPGIEFIGDEGPRQAVRYVDIYYAPLERGGTYGPLQLVADGTASQVDDSERFRFEAEVMLSLRGVILPIFRGKGLFDEGLNEFHVCAFEPYLSLFDADTGSEEDLSKRDTHPLELEEERGGFCAWVVGYS
jgi:hypothetical protein